MRIHFAHFRERSTTGDWIDFAVFDARSPNRTQQADSALLSDLTMKARQMGLKIDQSALAFEENGAIRFWGDTELVKFLSQTGLPPLNRWIDV